MGRSASRYDGQARRAAQPRVGRCGGFAVVVCVMFAASADGAPPPLRELDETVFVRAQRAEQAPDALRLTASGEVRLRSGAWEILADEAVVSGPLRDPHLIEVSGRPARLRVQRKPGEEAFEGHSRRLEFEPREEVVRLEGDARVVNGARAVSSETIEYLLDRDIFSAGSTGRVRVVTTPR